MNRFPYILLLVLIILTGCVPVQNNTTFETYEAADTPIIEPESEQTLAYPTRPVYQPGELVEYIAQSGDTIPALAAHFNTTEEEIMEANPVIPESVTTLPSGLPLSIPIYYRSLWGNPFQIIPDTVFVNGPSAKDFDPVAFVDQMPGWFKEYQFYAGDQNRRGGELIQHIANNFSIHPKVLLLILEYKTHALTESIRPVDSDGEYDLYPLGLEDISHQGLYRQLVMAANILNNGYYGWRSGDLIVIDAEAGWREFPDPWQNAGTVAIHYYLSFILGLEEFNLAVVEDGIYQTFLGLFGNPWEENIENIPGSLEQPAMLFPFEAGRTWAYTGGPHTGWGDGLPFAAIDFAPPSVVGGCSPSTELVTAVADGMIVRSGPGYLILDLDRDGDERTGWAVLYLHIATNGKKQVGEIVTAGEPLGYPSCEGGRSTGTHIHIARKYNGEWMASEGPLAFNLEGWIAFNGESAYEGTLQKVSQIVTASDTGSSISLVTAGPTIPE